MPTTSGSVMMLATLNGMPNQPINPTSQSVPMPTGNNDRITGPMLRKWNQTKSAIAAREYQAAWM